MQLSKTVSLGPLNQASWTPRPPGEKQAGNLVIRLFAKGRVGICAHSPSSQLGQPWEVGEGEVTGDN